MLSTVDTQSSPLISKPLAALALVWQSLAAYGLDTYRPEQHYMRGPGPKWRAKHGARALAPANHVNKGTRANEPEQIAV